MEPTQIDQRIAATEARLARLRDQRRKLDTRRKVLLGALLQHEMDTDAESERAILTQLERFLTRPADRALFDFPERIASLPERIDTTPAALGKLLERFKRRRA